MLTLEEARERILAAARPLPMSKIPLDEAAGLFAAQRILSDVNLPPADHSSMDGYAVRAADLLRASSKTPVALRLAGVCPAGRIFSGTVKTGTCVRIYTGSVMPRGADAVVMQEDVARNNDQIIFREAIAPAENVRICGEDVKKNSVLLETGEEFTPGRLALLAAAGARQVPSRRRPIVGLIATGSELHENGKHLKPGAIFESNRVSLAAMAAKAGAITKSWPIVKDDEGATRKVLREALAECDVVVTTGGVSVGDLDYVRAAFAGVGGQLRFWGIALRPGKPFAFGTRKGKLFFGLPGNPVSALVAFFLLARPALLRLQGAADIEPPSQLCVLGEALVNRGDRRHLLRVRLDAEGIAWSAGQQASHRLRAVGCSQGLVDVPPNTTLAKGAVVRVLRWD